MSQALLCRLLICILIVGLFLYTFINKQNEVTELKIEIPKLAKVVRRLQEENTRLCYEIGCHENPSALFKLLRTSEFSHLKQPRVSDVMVVQCRS